MIRHQVTPRFIPALLLLDGKLVKTSQFTEPQYVGDPVNVLSIFNDFEVDEIMLLDIGASRSRQSASIDELSRYASTCFVPLSYGGAVQTVGQAREIVRAGFEKIVVNTVVTEDPDAVRRMVAALGSQAVVGSVDVRLVDHQYRVFTRGAANPTGMTLDSWIELASGIGVGEILVTSIDREGTRQGFDLELIKVASGSVGVPVVAHGGAGDRDDLSRPILEAGASATAAGSIFVFQSGPGSVLVNYPTREQIGRLLGSERPPLPGTDVPYAAIASSSMSGVPSARICARCLITDDVPNAQLETSKVCYYCELHDQLVKQFPTGDQGLLNLERLADRLKEAGRGKAYDCIVGVSGGCDSSYLMHVMVGLGVRPLAVHFDNTWNTPTATANIYAVLDRLNVPLETYVVDNHEYDDLYRAFMLAGVKDVEAPTDIGFMGVLYRAAEAHGISHILEGHSFRTEGVSPLGWLYMDGGYIKSVHARYGTVPLKTYPNMTFGKFVKWAALSNIQRVRPLYHLDYNKEDAKALLQRKYGWQWYGGHHLENRFTAFYHTYLLPTRFGIDFRQIEFSALVRSGQMDRDTGLSLLHQERVPDPELIDMVQKRLGFSAEDFQAVMQQPHHTYREFHTYKKRFERLRPIFWALYRMDRVPRTFYEKFCV